MTRIELLYHIEQLTKEQLARRSDEQLHTLYTFLSQGGNAQPFARPATQPAPEEPTETLHVSPMIQICDTKYGGNVTVPKSTASQLRRMMREHRAREMRANQFIDHGTRDHGAIS